VTRADAFVGEEARAEISVCVGPDDAHELDSGARAGDLHGLVAALASGAFVEVAPEHGLSRNREALGAQAQSDREAADDRDPVIGHPTSLRTSPLVPG
jgi:hypothetical protein